MKAWRLLLVVGLALAVLIPGCWLIGNLLWYGDPFPYETIELADLKLPPPPKDELTDDTLSADQGPKFDAQLVHSQPIEGWRINLSAVVVKLDVEMARPDYEQHLVTLFSSYAAAMKGHEMLPSVNLIDGKAKQFDDGLYAALDLAYYRGLEETLHGHADLVRQIAEKAGPGSPAAAYLAAALELAGVKIDVNDKSAQTQWRTRFDSNLTQSKPIGFYTWSDDLKACFRFLRFLQQEVPLRPARGTVSDGNAAMVAIAQVLEDDVRLRDDYQKAVAFYSRLTNPPRKGVHLLSEGPARLQSLAPQSAVVAFFPSSTSRENELFEKLFPQGLPPNADLIQALIRAVRSGEVDFAPRDDSGWYDYQAYALETLLLPERGEEAGKLLRTARYKRRMLEAFAALITKRRETHVREMGTTSAMAAPAPLDHVSPRLRLEPSPTYYLRTARAYSFLQQFLEQRIGHDQLATLHGLREGSERTLDLASELDQMRALFYGFYLLSCEDLGMRPIAMADETGDPAVTMASAENWLKEIDRDPDLAADTRVMVPIFYSRQRQTTSVWATAGIRLVKLVAEFDERFRPLLRPVSGGEWKLAESDILTTGHYLIAVDEFVTCELPRQEPLSREEFRKLCDEHGTKEKILAALQAPRP